MKEKYVGKDIKMEERIIKENTGLIMKIANYFYGIDKKDLFQAGALGLIKAYQNYKSSENTKFSTYAYSYIYGEMYNLAMNKDLKVSRDLKKLYYKLEKYRYTLAQIKGYIPSNQELANYLNMPIQKIEEAYAWALNVISLDSIVEEERNLYECIANPEVISPDDKILINSSLDTLLPLEKDIINASYYEDLTQSETAKKLGISQVKVSRYETRSLKKMRDFMYM